MFEKNGGRPELTVGRPTLDENLRTLLAEFTAGDPMREGVLWTNLSLRELSRRLIALGTPTSRRAASATDTPRDRPTPRPHA